MKSVSVTIRIAPARGHTMTIPKVTKSHNFSSIAGLDTQLTRIVGAINALASQLKALQGAAGRSGSSGTVTYPDYITLKNIGASPGTPPPNKGYIYLDDDRIIAKTSGAPGYASATQVVPLGIGYLYLDRISGSPPLGTFGDAVLFHNTTGKLYLKTAGWTKEVVLV